MAEKVHNGNQEHKFWLSNIPLCIYVTSSLLLSHEKNEIMPSAATWMALKIIILNEIGQKEKDEYHMISVIRGV